MAEYFKPKSGKTFAYSQNHTFIPIAGLGVTAYALYDETPEAPAWASLSRAIFDRVLATYSQDGYYYEGFEYWIFSTPWLVHYLDAARKYMDAAVSYDIWGYPNNKPNVDLAAGHLLYGLGWGYDLLYHDLTNAERTRYREKLI